MLDSLYWACRRGDKPLATSIVFGLAHGIDGASAAKYVNPNSPHDTPLHQASRQGWLDIVKPLIELCGMDPEVTDSLHQSPLHYACQYGHIKIVKYLIERGCNPLLQNMKQLEPLDYALSHDSSSKHGTDIAAYICQSSISSAMMLMPERSAVTAKLVKYVALHDTPHNPSWKTSDDLYILHLACTSESYTSCIPSFVMQMLIKNGIVLDAMKPNWKTANGDTIFHLVCQSESCMSCLSSKMMLSWLSDKNVTTSMLLHKPGIPNWKTADGNTIRDLVWQSPSCISKIPSKVIRKMLSKWVHSSATVYCKTADGITLLQLIYQSKSCVSQVTSKMMLEWLKEMTVDMVENIVPDWKTADDDTLFRLICQSDVYLSQIPSVIMLQWVSNIDLIPDLKTIVAPDMKTADGDSLLQIVCQSKLCISHISSIVILNWLTKTILDFEKIILVNSETADGYSILSLIICQFEKCLLRVPSVILLKWLNETTFDIIVRNMKTADGATIIQAVCQMESDMSCIPSRLVLKELTDVPIDLIITPNWMTENDDTRLQLLCVSELCISHAPSSSLLKWLNSTTLDLGRIVVPNWKTADGDTLLQLVCQSENCMLKIYSDMLLKWLSDPTVNLVQIIEVNSKTSGTFLQLVLQSESCISRIPSKLMLKWLIDPTQNHVKLIVPDWKTADGDTLLQLVCQSEISLSRVPSGVVRQWFNHASLIQDLQTIIIAPEMKTADGVCLLQIVCQSEMYLLHIASEVMLEWLTKTIPDINIMELITVPNWKTADGDTLLQLVCQSEKCLAHISSHLIHQWFSNTTDNLGSIIIPDMRTANGDTLFQFVCISETSLSRVSSSVLLKWLSDTSLDLVHKIAPNGKTADGDTLLQLVCQSKAYIERIPSSILLNWLCDTTVDLIIPNTKTADGDTIVQIVYQLESTISCTPPRQVMEELTDTPINLIITPNWNTEYGNTRLHVLCLSNLCISHIPSSLLLKWLNSMILDLGRIIKPNWKTADGDTLLSLVYQSKACISQMSSVILLQWISDESIDPMKLILDPNWMTSDGKTLLQLVCQSETCFSRIPSATLLMWLSNTEHDLLLHNWKTADNCTIVNSICQAETNISCLPSKQVLSIVPAHVDMIITSNSKADNDNDDDQVYLLCLWETCISRIPSSVIVHWMNNTTLNLWEISVPNWKTADSDTLIQLVSQSEVCLSQIPSMQVLKWLNNCLIDQEVINCNFKTADGDILLQLICQSESFLSNVSSSLLLMWLNNTDFDLGKVIVPHWKTADNNTLLQLICASEQCISRVSSSVLLKWIRETCCDYDVLKRLLPTWKTADGIILINLFYTSDSSLGINSVLLLNWLSYSIFDVLKTIKPNQKVADALLRQICQSEVHLSHIPSAVLSKWLNDTMLNFINILRPELRTAEGETVLQLICQSKYCLSRIPSGVILQWFHHTTHDLLMHNWKTADGDTIIQVLCHIESEIVCLPSKLILKEFTDTPVDLVITPNWRTDTNGDTHLVHAFCMSGLCMSHIQSSPLLKWLMSTTLNNIGKIIVPTLKTADGDTLLQLILCQCRSWISQLSSEILLKWLSYGGHDIFRSIIPEIKTADGETLFRIICRSEKCLMQISSSLILEWLSRVAFDICSMHNLNHKTADGDTLFQLVCTSESFLCEISSAVFLNGLNDNNNFNTASKIYPNCETANGDTLLQLICQSKAYIQHVSSSVLLDWLCDTTVDLIIPNVKTADGDTIVQVIYQSDSNFSCIPSTQILKELTNSPVDVIITSKWRTGDADIDTRLQVLCISEYSISHLLSSSLLYWLSSTTLDLNKTIGSFCNCKTADGATLLQVIFQSKAYIHNIPSSVLFKWLHATAVDIIVPNIQMADGVTIIQVVYQSESKIVCMPLTPALLKELSHARIDLIFTPNWRIEDGDTRLQLICLSELYMSHIPSSLLLNWLNSTTLDLGKIIEPNWKTTDDDTLLQLICQSARCTSKLSSSLLLKWFDDTTLDLVNFTVPEIETADGDTLFQLICQCKTYISCLPSSLLLKWIKDSSLNFEKSFELSLKTADCDALLLLVFQSESHTSLIPSSTMLKWFSETVLDLIAIIVPIWRTADDDTLLQLVCQSEKCLSRISSSMLLRWLKNGELIGTDIVLDGKTADGDTIPQLLCQFVTLISHVSSPIMIKWLNMKDSEKKISKLMITINPNQKTADGDAIPHLLCQSNMKENEIVELLHSYLQKDLLDPDIINNNGSTALHLACQTNKPTVVRFLFKEAHCNANIENKANILPLDATSNPEIVLMLCESVNVSIHSRMIERWLNDTLSIDNATMIDIFQLLLHNDKLKTSDGSTLLHLTCIKKEKYTFRDKVKLVNYLLTEADCDPNCLDKDKRMSLQLTFDPRIMKKLIYHGATVTPDVVFRLISDKVIPDHIVSELFLLSRKKMTMSWKPSDLNDDGDTALHAACKAGSRPTVISFLIENANCDPNARNNAQKELPLELTSDIKTMEVLVHHGARMTPEIILNLEATESIPKDVLIQLMSESWHPDDKNIDGNTALHLACKADRPDTVNFLLSAAHCNPNNKNEITNELPLEMTTNPEIIKDLIKYGAQTSMMYQSCKDALRTSKPIIPPVKMFVVGNPSVGKSTLTAALKKRLNRMARIFTSGKVSGVDQKTVGIVPHEMEDDVFGRITVYDFAGHKEFYSGHAALLQTAIQTTPPIFLIVVNICDDKDVIDHILYWISFLENHCVFVVQKPHVIVVGSHADALKSKGVSLQERAAAIKSLLNDAKYFRKLQFIDFISMDCQYHESTGMNELRQCLVKSCNELRIQEPIPFNAHCFLVYLIETFIDTPAVTISAICEKIDQSRQSAHSEIILSFLPEDMGALYKICIELNDRGHILFLKNRSKIEHSYIVIDKDSLLAEVSGTVFAPEGFKEYKQLSTNTGVVSLSKIAECFPGKDLKILIGFLNHLEFCHEISDQALCELICKMYVKVPNERYYLFPALISLNAEDTVWETKTHFDHDFGWILKCTNDQQFFSSRFLQVLLLRLAFLFALSIEVPSTSQSLGIHRKCSLWKNGIFWGREFGMETLVEVLKDKSVIVIARFQASNIEKCIKHRSKVLSTILECAKEFCPRIFESEEFKESFVDTSSSILQYPFVTFPEKALCTVHDIADALVSDCREPSVVSSATANSIPANEFLSFEPYTEIERSVLHKLWDNEKEVMSNAFLSRFIQQASGKPSWFVKLFSEEDYSSSNEDDLMQTLSKWKDNQITSCKTFKDLRLKLDEYSVFLGRDLLVSMLLAWLHEE